PRRIDAARRGARGADVDAQGSAEGGDSRAGAFRSALLRDPHPENMVGLRAHRRIGAHQHGAGELPEVPAHERGHAPGAGQPASDREGGMGSPVLIVVVNYRTSDLAVECLRSIEAEAGDPAVARVVVVDNHSGDGSVDRLRAAIARNGWARWAEVIPSDRNGG